jgi:hypothetical protein
MKELAVVTLNPVFDIESGKRISHDGQELVLSEKVMQFGGGPGPDWTPDDALTQHNGITTVISSTTVSVAKKGEKTIVIDIASWSIVPDGGK